VTTYPNTSLASGTTYYYRVRAWSGAGDSAYSNEAHATTFAVLSTNIYLPVVLKSYGGGGGVLWDQPLSPIDQNAFVDQLFPDAPTFSSYLADDFTNGTRGTSAPSLSPAAAGTASPPCSTPRR